MQVQRIREAERRPKLQRRNVAAAILLLLAGACLDNAMSPPFGFLVIPPDTLPQALRPVVNIQCPGYKHYDVRPLTLWLPSDAPISDTVQVTVLGRKPTDTTTCSVVSDRFGLSPLQPVLDSAFFDSDSTVQIALHATAAA